MRRSYRFSCNSGLSLAEVLLTMSLLLVVMATLAGLAREYSQVLRFTSGKDATLEAALVALTRSADESREALVFSHPAPGNFSPDSELAFERERPDQSMGLALPPDVAPVPPWDPADPTRRLSVRYYRSAQNRLVREVDDGTVIEPQELAEGVTGFQVTRQPDGGLVIAISVQEASRVKSLSTRVSLPLEVTP